MMLAPRPPLGPAAPRGGAALCVCLASRGLTVLWKVCFVNIAPVFFFFSVSDSRGDGEKEKAAHDPAHPPPEIPQSQPAQTPPGSGHGDVLSLCFLFLFFKHIKYFTYVFTANKCKLVPSNMLRFDIKKWC